MKPLRMISLPTVFVILILQGCLPTVDHASATPLPSGSSLQATSTLPLATSAPTIASSTSLPTDDGEQAVYELVQGNGGCELPCVLGLTPGESIRSDVQGLMSFFGNGASNRISETNSLEVHNYLDSVVRKGTSSSSVVVFWRNRIRAQLNIGYLYGSDGKIEQIVLSSEAWEHSGQGSDEGARVLYDDKSYADLVKSYSLDRVLSLYGPPEQIVVLPFPDDPGHPSPPAHYPFSFVLYYPERGFLIEYSAARGERDDFYVGCPTASHISISTWDPEKPLSIEEAVRYFSDLYGINPSTVTSFREIQDVTDLDIASFYETFKVPTDKCIETLSNLWPLPGQ